MSVCIWLLMCVCMSANISCIFVVYFGVSVYMVVNVCMYVC